ncbi:MAG: endolytic transglycosylase MltG [Methylococcales bacterium]|nr:endolytic transglycosylase MltG [Methylococcales bacterium]MDD5755075.1 endolytic transglycosylase MltG [Methylococcales bacterium]
MPLNKIASYILIGFSYIGGWLWMDYESSISNPTIFDKPVTIEIEKGENLKQITDKLVAQNVKIKPFWFKILAKRNGANKKIKSGEYELTKGVTAKEILALFVQGKVKQHAITFPEGWNFKEIRHELDANPYIEHTLQTMPFEVMLTKLEISQHHPEGLFFPDTYFFEKHTTDVAILKRAYRKMQVILAKEWQNKAENLPLTTPYQALILASIIEKETAAPVERTQIAGVFSRRLQQNMMLQTDPTVIYGMGEMYRGDIKTADLQNPTPYNTYTFKGLPPTPIAMAGREAIHAALHPDTSDTLFFVAKGDGTHVFSTTLDAHNAAVEIYQRHKNEVAQ